MFRTRLLSGIVLVILAAIMLTAGQEVLLIGLYLISLVGLFEIYRVVNIEKSPLGWPGYGAVTIYYLLIYLKGTFYQIPPILPLALLMVCLGIFVFTFPKYQPNQVMMAFFGFFYVAVMLSFIYGIRHISPEGIFLVWLIFLSSWGCDTCAYCVGMLVGKHKLAPILSPKKSIEGAIGGSLGAALLGAIFGFVLKEKLPIMENPALHCAIICLVGSVIAQVGDLAASAIKRSFKVKDYGTLIPGHGGILDRFDSVIFVAPVIYYGIYFLSFGLAY